MSDTIAKQLSLFGVDDEEPVDQNTNTGTQTADTTQETEQVEEAAPIGEGTGTDDPAQRTPKQDTQTGVRLPANDAGDLVHPHTGEVIAKAGRERFLFQRMRDEHLRAENTTRELEAVRREVEAYKQASTLHTQLGLAPNDVTNALQFMAHWKRDPAGAAKEVLTAIRAMGHNVDDLGSHVDMGAIKQLVSESIQPFVEDRQARTIELEAEQAAQREIDEVYARYAWAADRSAELKLILDDDIAKAKKEGRQSTLTLREAALQLAEYAIANGLDLYKPIAPQVQAIQAGTQRQNNARVPTRTSSTSVQPRRNVPASESMNSRDIVRQALLDAGINIE